MSKHIIIGGGMAGLSAAVHLKSQNQYVQLYEASKYLGGRCRSYFDPHLNMTLDNGNHLILGCNQSIFKYLKTISSSLDKVKMPLEIYDYKTRQKLKMPWFEIMQWLLMRPKSSSQFLKHLWVSIQNTDPDLACPIQFQNCLRSIFFNLNWTPYQPSNNLTESLITPAEDFIGEDHLSILNPLLKIEHHDSYITHLHFKKNTIAIVPNDQIIFALPLPILNDLLDLNLDLNQTHNPITNIHFKIDHGLSTPHILGLVNAKSHWVFIKKDHISITISNQMIQASQKEKMISDIWDEVRFLFPDLPAKIPPHKMIIEKYATLNQTQAQLKNLPHLDFQNATFIGDWTYSHFPNTIESAMKSGLICLKK